MKTLSYEVVDVFTDRPFTGNPLAVVFGADGLAGEQMQALAREFHLSETVFLLPPTGAATYRARIFTPEEELPFAGHPSVGAAVTGLRRGLFAAGEVVQECGAGLLPVHVSAEGRARLTGGKPTAGEELDPAPLLEVVGLSTTDFAGPPPRAASCGLEFHYLPVRPDAVPRAAGDPTAARRHGIAMLSVFAWDPATATARTRVFCPGVGVPEDPATGSAALGFGVWLVASGLLPGEGESAYTVRQGVELHRPSTLDCMVAARGGAAVSTTVTGQVVPIARGEITVPPFIG
ncbi:MAG TPA: PhzF family phenazine biosynthesis protein [Micromonosporaceae bacterium]|nr:PhzF family phenazine biosynthesis protein [Micromonosporaceae bacterium]